MSTKRKVVKKKKVYIYGIYLSNETSSEKLAYIGSTFDIDERTKSHVTKLQTKKHSNKTLSKLYHDGDIIDVRVLYEVNTDNTLIKMIMEMCAISYLNPPCNKCVYQVGMSRLVFSKAPSDLAQKLLDCILEYYTNK